ncbi:hypothetical protein N9878_00935, partial [bacterium]|nr:hypothetical protein [bacterium]
AQGVSNRIFRFSGNPAGNTADGITRIAVANEKAVKVRFVSEKFNSGVNGNYSVAIYRSDTDALVADLGTYSITEAGRFLYEFNIDVSLVEGVEYYVAGIAMADTYTSNPPEGTAVGESAVNTVFQDPFGAVVAWNPSILAIETTLGASITGPPLVTGNDPALVITGIDLSVDPLDKVTVQASLDAFATAPTEFIELPTSNRTATTAQVDFNSGYADSITTKLSQFLIRFSDANWSVRWLYKDDAGEDRTLNFTHNPVATHIAVPAAKSEYLAGVGSMLDNAQAYMSETDQLYMPKEVQNTEGGITTLAIDYDDAGHPMINFFGGDAEQVTATVEYAIGNSDGKARSQELDITPAPPVAAFGEEFTEPFV